MNHLKSIKAFQRFSNCLTLAFINSVTQHIHLEWRSMCVNTSWFGGVATWRGLCVPMESVHLFIIIWVSRDVCLCACVRWLCVFLKSPLCQWCVECQEEQTLWDTMAQCRRRRCLINHAAGVCGCVCARVLASRKTFQCVFSSVCMFISFGLVAE